MPNYSLPQPLKQAMEIVNKARPYYGVCTKVAKQLDVDLTHVTRVFKGERRSPRIEAALAWEIERVNRSLKNNVAAA